MKIVLGAKLDPNLTAPHILYLLERFQDKKEAFVETFELPEQLAELPCALHGPAMGDDPLRESDIFYQRREGRKNLTRFVHRPPRLTKNCTVVAGPSEGDDCVLYAAFGGPLAPREPGDIYIQSQAELRESTRFWQEHAFSAS